MPRTTSFLRKFIACLTLSLLSAGTILQLGTPPAPFWLNQTVIFIGCVLCLVIPLVALPVWENQERKGNMDLSFLFLRLQNIIGYLTGFGISLFGWKKLFHLQFRTPISIADLPMSGLNGETLTWYYFGHSNAFGCLIGIIQLSGSFLLFFRKTRFAGALFLLRTLDLNYELLPILPGTG